MEIKIFKNPQFGAIRTTVLDGEPWFVGKDVATALGYSDPPRAVRSHVCNEDKGAAKMPSPGGMQTVIMVNESGLYSLILSSKLPSAKQFKHWVTSEILPSISRTGGYNTDSTMWNIMRTLAAMQRALETQQEISKKLLAQLQTPPTVPDEPEQLAFTEHSARALPLNQTRGKKGGKAKTTPLRWFNVGLYNDLYNAYPKTLRELAQEVGVHVVTLRAWRNGKSRPTVNNARKLAAVLGVAEEDLFLE